MDHFYSPDSEDSLGVRRSWSLGSLFRSLIFVVAIGVIAYLVVGCSSQDKETTASDADFGRADITITEPVPPAGASQAASSQPAEPSSAAPATTVTITGASPEAAAPRINSQNAPLVAGPAPGGSGGSGGVASDGAVVFDRDANRNVIPGPQDRVLLHTPQCDGRGILIVQSVISTSVDQDIAQMESALASYPNSRVMKPGQCASIRGSVNGATVYPVYIDYGSNTSALCAAKARYGGNARTLNSAGDFSDPC